MVKINTITAEEGIQCEVLAKCEYLNPGGSVKDRIGVRMVQDAEESGVIRPGFTLIEPTSGNTGIGLCMTAAVKGYKIIITLPEKMSREKSDTMKILGAQIIRTPTDVAFDDADSNIMVAERLERELENAKILNQCCNASNPLVHYDQTAEEIIDQCDGRLDYCVLAAGTGGTLTGISRKLKEKVPGVQIIGVDPEGSIIADPEHDTPGIYKVEGIGYDFVPRVCDTGLVDQWYRSNDQDSFDMARRLIRKEGLLVGGSSGSSMDAAIKLAKTLPADKRVVVLLADSIRNYMTKFISDSWMIENGFMQPEDSGNPLIGKQVKHLTLTPCSSLGLDTPCGDVLTMLENTHANQAVITNGTKPVGVVSTNTLYTALASRRALPTDPCEKIVDKTMKVVGPETPLSSLTEMIESSGYAVYSHGEVVAVLTGKDLLAFSSGL